MISNVQCLYIGMWMYHNVYSRANVVSTSDNMAYEMISIEGTVNDDPDEHIYETIGCGATNKSNPVTSKPQSEANYVNVFCRPHSNPAVPKPMAQPTAKIVGIAQEGVKKPAYYNLQIMTKK